MSNEIPVSAIAPTPVAPTLPTEWQTLEARAEHFTSVVKAWLTGRSLPFLQDLEALLQSGKALPGKLETYRTYVESFLQNAIAYAQDAIALAQMIAQLELAAAVPLSPAAQAQQSALPATATA